MQINKESECETIKKKIIKTQKDWVEHFNNKGEKMISAPDIYKSTKKDIIESLKADFQEKWIITSTRIIYNKDNLNAEIIHDADSTIVKPKIYNIKVPIIEGDFKQDSETELYLQALFDTKDKINKILKTLKKFGKDNLTLYTPTQSQRNDYHVCSVDLCFGCFGRFDVFGFGRFDYGSGFSRGVLVNSAKQSKKLKCVTKCNK